MLKRTRKALKRLASPKMLSRSGRRRSFSFEALEDRRAMAILTVTTLQDVNNSIDGVTSLREAINTANSNADSQNTIRFSPALVGNTINLVGGELAVRKSLQIDIADGAKLTIDAGRTSRVFQVYENVLLTAEQLELKNGSATNGGAIYVRRNGSLALSNSELVSNFASNSGGAIFGETSTSFQISNSLFQLNTANAHGGAIRVENLTSTTIVSSQFVQNTADVDQVSSGDGGAIYSRGQLTVSQSQFSSNRGRNGGGVYGATASNLNLSDNSFTSNTARTTGGGIVVYSGILQAQRLQLNTNAAGTEGGAVYVFRSPATIVDSDFNTNIATGSGGGIFTTTMGSLAVTGGSFSSNVAGNESGGIHIRSNAVLTNVDFLNNRAAFGGALSSRDSTTVTISDSLFSGNQATSRAGFIRMLGSTLNIRNSIVSQNKAPDGGAMYVSSGVVNIEGTEFNGNEATNSGGAIFNVTTVNVLGGSFLNNKASSGGAVAGNPNSVFNADPLIVGTVSTPTLFSNNYASNRGGAAYSSSALIDLNQAVLRNNSSATGGGGAIYLYGGRVVIGNSTLEDNVTLGRGAAIYASPATAAPSIALSNNVLSNNVASQEGGGVYLSSGSLTDQGSDFLGNRADRGGGGIWATSSSSLTLNQSIFRSNSGLGDGGAVRTSSSTVNITNSLFELNSIVAIANSTSGGRGGALYASGGTVTVADSTFTENSSSDDGGALFFGSLAAAGATIDSCSLQGNVSNEDGGAIATSSSKLTLLDSALDGNIANNGRGGALYAFIGSSNITNTLLVDNSASADGGAIYADGSSPTTMILAIQSSTFSMNHTVDDGAAIFAANATLNIDATIFESNVSGDDGGAIYLKPLVNATISNSQFLNNVAQDVSGVIFIRESSAYLVDCVMTGNLAHGLNGTAIGKGKNGLLNYDNSAIAHASARFTRTTIDGSFVAEATIATSMNPSQLNDVFDDYEILEDWI